MITKGNYDVPVFGQALTKRETQAFKLIGSAVSYEKIGQEMNISKRTVIFYMAQIKTKLGLNSRYELVAMYSGENVFHINSRRLTCLTKKESVVYGLLVAGATNAEIASQMCRSINTVRGHASSILVKLDCRCRESVIRKHYGKLAA
jgi:DNA-binding CsgD family transcriptional regulator